MSIRRSLGALAMSALVLGSTACGGSASADEVCSKYDKVAKEIANDKVKSAFNGDIFDALDNLAKKVKDFDDQPKIQATGKAMLDMANDDSASIEEVQAMIEPVKTFCASN